MDRSSKTALIGLPISLLIAAGLAWAGSWQGVEVAGIPVFAAAVALSLLIQWVAFIPAWLQRTERFYDLIGSITFLSVLVLEWWLGPPPDGRTILLMMLIDIWAIRLGIFLFSRIEKQGSDSRFDEIKRSFVRFLLAWTMQGLWVSFSLAAALAAMTSTVQKELGSFALIGTLLWLSGFAIEVIADYQKRKFREQPGNKGRFIQSGLWAWSRHPNYFGEIVLWVGIAVIAAPVLQGWQYLTLISPVFVTLLLTRISGIPPLEAHADEKWGGQADYEAYKGRTPVLIPRPPAAA